MASVAPRSKSSARRSSFLRAAIAVIPVASETIADRLDIVGLLEYVSRYQAVEVVNDDEVFSGRLMMTPLHLALMPIQGLSVSDDKLVIIL